MITEVQKEFNDEFPFLRLEFLQTKPSVQHGLSLKRLITHNRKIGELQTGITDGDIEVKEDMKVEELEKIFKDRFGFIVQVFRHSGNLWLETTMTDSWTLRQQNEHGEEISSVKTNKPAPAEDYDLSRDLNH
jgi:hypothetical protein